MHAAAEAGDIVSIDAALKAAKDAGTPIDTRDARGRTPLLVAVMGGHTAAALRLIEAGADVNAQDADQTSPFLFAASRGRIAVLRRALAAGADLKATNRFGSNALHGPAYRGQVESVERLLAAGVDPNLVNRLGWTPLLECIALGDGSAAHVAIVRLLVGAGASLTATDPQGLTPLQLAEQRGQAAVAAVLRAARPAAQNRRNAPP